AVVATGERYQLTNSKKSSSDAKWSPAGNRLAFSSDREGKRQIYLISPTGGEASQLTKVETGINQFEWSPDGRRIAFTAAEPETKTLKDRVEKYGEFTVIERDYTMSQLWMIDIPAANLREIPEAKRLTEGTSFTVGDFSWSPDSKQIAFSAARDPDLGSQNTS